MKTDKLQKKTDALDIKIVRLFERRMCTVKKAAEHRAKHDMLPRRKKKRLHAAVVQKTTQTACDTEVIAYTEGLIMYILSVSEKFFRQAYKAKRKKQ